MLIIVSCIACLELTSDKDFLTRKMLLKRLCLIFFCNIFLNGNATLGNRREILISLIEIGLSNVWQGIDANRSRFLIKTI